MDFCHPCRRHLNGALACPGCGTPVEELRAHAEEADVPPPSDIALEPYRTDGSGTPDGHEHGHDDAGAPQGRAARRRAQGRGRGPGREAGEEVTGPVGAGSRRDRKAAAHRRRRRRTLLLAAGFVLAAGGLSVAELGIDVPFATSRPPAAGGANTSSETGEAAQPLDSATGRGARSKPPNASVSASASESPSPSVSKSADGKATRSSTAGTSPVTPTAGRTATSPTGTTTPTANPTTSKPGPLPSQTCTRFLWWCG
ncbi:SCO2400 family protein [Streptomyces sp. NPDC001617]